MTTTATRCLVIGATGRLGTKIVSELRALGAAVRITSRSPAKLEALTELRASGVELVTADLADAASLERACQGIDVVVCAVQGLREIIVDGQTRLLRAAEAAGVARMLPSDFALDFFKTADGGNRNLDLRREFNRLLDASSVRGTSVLCGAFMDLIAMGAIAPDRETGSFKHWGDADQPYDFTVTDDVAKYIAAAAIDAEAGRFVRVAGDVKSPRELAAIFAEVRGVPVPLVRSGSIEELDQAIARLRALDADPTAPFPVWQQMQYMRDMASGLGKLAPLDNERYPQIRPRSVRDLLRNPAPR